MEENKAFAGKQRTPDDVRIVYRKMYGCYPTDAFLDYVIEHTDWSALNDCTDSEWSYIENAIRKCNMMHIELTAARRRLLNEQRIYGIC